MLIVMSPSSRGRQLARAGRGPLGGFFAGLLPRTASLAGSLFVFPFTMETVQPLIERHRHRWRGADS